MATAAALVAFALAGCGESRELTTNTTGASVPPPPRAPGSPPSPGPAGMVVAVTESEYELHPAQVHLPRSGLIDLRVHNSGKRPHALVLETSVGKLQTGLIRPGATAEIRVRLRRGLYRWYSPVAGDRRRGMSGELVVGQVPRR